MNRAVVLDIAINLFGISKNINDIPIKGLIATRYGFLLPHLVYLVSLIHPNKNWEAAMLSFPKLVARNVCHTGKSKPML